ncbi:hypothetical protein [uncultured Thiothrix sp.]|uniref:hypothetical protein n=1 Tax=uncultured Thiothrix sp. TaxID=223185 RepID=UPI002617C930|nr:hypothetical protein [uncultured Thiothrix sp.]
MKRLMLLNCCVLMTACSEPDMGNFTPGMVDTCRAMPAFIKNTGLGTQVAIDTQQQGYVGLRLVQPQTGQTWQHPTWDDAGHVGATTRDQQGNIYLAPTPEVSLAENPPALQNRIYRVDSQTGEMQVWLELPQAAQPSAVNPFGVMGLFYDCDTHSLYASSLAGSTPQQAQGRLYQIDMATKQVIDQIEQVDAIGVGVFNGVPHKRLYFGSARSSDVYSLPLDAQGHFINQPRHEFALATLPNGNTTSARRFVFTKAGSSYALQVKELEFGFRLLAENNLRRRSYTFNYQADRDEWLFQGSQPEMAQAR